MRFPLCPVVAFSLLAAAAAGRTAAPGTCFRDCADCAEMIPLPGGTFSMGSDSTEQAWAAAHGATLESVADESPKHTVTLRPFAIGKYNVTRGEFAAFVKATGFKPADGCGRDGGKWEKLPGVTWDHPGFEQDDRDPVVCVTWHDAKAYIAWLNAKVRSGRVYRLPTEGEWEYAARAGTTTMFWWGDGAEAAGAHA